MKILNVNIKIRKYKNIKIIIYINMLRRDSNRNKRRATQSGVGGARAARRTRIINVRKRRQLGRRNCCRPRDMPRPSRTLLSPFQCRTLSTPMAPAWGLSTPRAPKELFNEFK